MRLADVTVALRPRSPWEATDLGLAMTQAWWRAVYPPFLVAVVAAYGLVSLLLWSSPLWVPVVMWWLKPLFDRLLLHVYSQALFGSPPTTRQTLAALPRLLGRGLWAQLTLLRLDTIRSFRTPVMQLEGLAGRARRERLRILARRGRSHAAGLTVVAVHMDAFLALGTVALVALVVPPELGIDVLERLTTAEGAEALGWNLLLLTGFVIVEPLYVAAGFGLYLNRRTELEGWDIELRLRRIAARLAAPAATTAMLLALLLVPPQEAWGAIADTPLAEPRRPAAEAPAIIAEVLADEDFDTTRSFSTWRWRGEGEAQEEQGPDLEWLGRWMVWLARIIEGLLWGVAAALVIAALWYARRWLPGLRRGPTPSAEPLPAVDLGLDPAAAPLPADVPAEARRLWRAGEHRAALSLLYRGSITRLAGAAAPGDAATEGEVLRALRDRLPAERYGYLRRVTAAWQGLAWGRRPPPAAEFEALLRDWPAAEGNTP